MDLRGRGPAQGREDFFDRVHRVNPTGRELSLAEQERRYGLKHGLAAIATDRRCIAAHSDQALAAGDAEKARAGLERPAFWQAESLQAAARLAAAWLRLETPSASERLAKRLALACFCHLHSPLCPPEREETQLLDEPWCQSCCSPASCGIRAGSTRSRAVPGPGWKPRSRPGDRAPHRDLEEFVVEGARRRAGSACRSDTMKPFRVGKMDEEKAKRLGLQPRPREPDSLIRARIRNSHARQKGRPTADPKELDCDVILASQAIQEGAHVVTDNVGHLALFVSASRWRDLRIQESSGERILVL